MTTASPAATAAAAPSLADWKARWAKWVAAGEARAAAPALAVVATIFALAVCFGGVDLWSFGIAAIGLGVALLALAYAVLRGLTGTWPGALMVGLTVLYIGLLVFIYSQSTATGWLPAHPLWAVAAKALGMDLPASASIAPDATRNGLLWLAFYGCLFWVAWYSTLKGESAKAALRGFLAIQCVLAVYGVLIYSTGNGSVFFVERMTYKGSLTSTFINRNSYATFAGMGAIMAFARLARIILREIDPTDKFGDKMQTVLTGLFTRHLGMVVVFSTLVLMVAFTQSRAGLVTTLIGLLAVAVILVRRRNTALGALLGVLLFLAAVGFAVIMVSGAEIGAHFADFSESASGRTEIYKAALQAAQEGPLTGTGLGSFQYTFYSYLSRELVGAYSYYAAHNTYLENAIELGWPAAALLAACPAALALVSWRGVLRRRRDYEFALGAVGVTVQVGLHSLFDFSLQIPAVTSAYVFLLAMGVAQSVSSIRSDR